MDLYSLEVVIYHLEYHLKRNKPFFEKKIFCPKKPLGDAATFFEKMFLLENILFCTPFDAVLRGDSEYHLGFSLRCLFNGGKGR